MTRIVVAAGQRARARRQAMTFQAYLDAVKANTARTPEQLKSDVAKAGVYAPNMRAKEMPAC